MLIARLFGVDIATDAFFATFKLPNFLRRLFAEGAFAHAFVPVLSDYKENQGKAELKAFIDKTSGTLALILLLITAAGVIAAPLLIVALAPGFAWGSVQHELAAELLRITLPYLFFISLTAFAGAILNVYGKFVIPAITPIWLNVLMIAAAIELAPRLEESVTALAWSVLPAEPLLFTQFQYDAFSVDDVHFAGRSLRGYSVGLSGFILIKVLAPAFTARMDLKTPVRFSVYAMIASLLMNVLAIPLAHAGLALATSLGALINAALLLVRLRRDDIFSPARGWGLFLLRIGLSTIIMSAPLTTQTDTDDWISLGSGERVLQLLMWIGVGIMIYLATLWQTGMRIPVSMTKTPHH